MIYMYMWYIHVLQKENALVSTCRCTQFMSYHSLKSPARVLEVLCSVYTCACIKRTTETLDKQKATTQLVQDSSFFKIPTLVGFEPTTFLNGASRECLNLIYGILSHM